MSKQAKWITAAVTAVSWALWLGSYAISEETPMGLGWSVASQALRLAAGLASTVLALGMLVSPVIATATVWREIGIKEQAKHCDHCPIAARRAAKLSNIIPVTFNGSISRFDDSVRSRDF